MYDGKIEPGMQFEWEPSKPHAHAGVEVTEVKTVDGDRLVYAKVLWGKGEKDKIYWNDMSRFREAVQPMSPAFTAQSK